MARRSITIPPELEKRIRSFQARSMEELNIDVSFTEVCNFLLAMGLFHRLKPEEWEELKGLLGGEDLSIAGLMDQLIDKSLFQLLSKQTKSSK